MEKKEYLTRSIAIFLSVLLFCGGIVLTLGIFLPITGIVSTQYALFATGKRIFSVYGFSSFLIPLLFLYGAVLLLLPGWSHETKAVFLGVPLYFITAFTAERLMNIFVPSVSIPVIRQFVVISIVICALLLVCFEVFLMLMVSERLASRCSFVHNLPVDEQTCENDELEDDEPERTEPESNTQDYATHEDIESEQTEVEYPADVPNATLSGTEGTVCNDIAVSSENMAPSEPVAALDSAHAAVPRPADAACSQASCKTAIDTVTQEAFPQIPALNAQTSTSQQIEAAALADEAQAASKRTIKPALECEASSAVELNTEPLPDREVEPAVEVAMKAAAAVTSQAEPEVSAVLERTEVSEVSAFKAPERLPGIEGELLEESDSTVFELSHPLSEGISLQREECPHITFDPSDPNNLFISLEEIIAPIERIKNAHSEKYGAKQEHTVPISDTCITEAEDIHQGSKDTAFIQEGPEQQSADLQTETAHNNFAAAQISDEELTGGRLTVAESAQKQEHAAALETAEPEVSASVAVSQADSAPAAVGTKAVSAAAGSACPAEAVAIPAEEMVEAKAVQADSALEVQEESELPLMFVNGVPLPNERSALLDTLVVLEPEQHTTAETTHGELQPTGITEQSMHLKTAALVPIDASFTKEKPESREHTVYMQASALLPQAAHKDMSSKETKNTTAADTASHTETAGNSLTNSTVQDEDEHENGKAASESNDEPDTEAKLLHTLETLEQEVQVIPAKPLPPTPPRKKYTIPFDLLTNYPDGEYWIIDDATRRAAFMLKSTFNEFKIDVSITGIRKGPVVTMFEMLPSPGIKLSKITNLQDNIALRLAASSVRIVAPIPGKHAVGIEVPNKKRAIVSFRELIETDLPEASKMAIPVALGKDVTGNLQLLDLAQTPHLLIAGATGSGKSVCVNAILLSILYNRRPDEVKLILVDPKIVELKLYNDIAHLLTPVITEPKRAFQALQYALCEMERRYALLDNMGVRDIKTYNAKIKSERIATETLPYIVIIIDEFADLMATSGKELEAIVARLCAMSRAVGIHLVLATQRPSIDVITGLIKANIPSRIAFMVASKTDSRIILDEMGAEKLLGKGDMLYVSAARPYPTRIQGAFVSEHEVERVVACVKDYCEPEYIDDEIFVDDDDEPYDSALFSDENDPLYEQALEIVTFAGKASASYVQRKLKIGYNRAARLIEEMEARGIVGPANGSKAREILRHA